MEKFRKNQMGKRKNSKKANEQTVTFKNTLKNLGEILSNKAVASNSIRKLITKM